MSRTQLLAAGPQGDPDNPPDRCFEPDAEGTLPSCTYSDGQWHRSYDTGVDVGPGGGGGVPDAFAAFFLLALVGGIAVTVWKVSTARRMAREAGLDEGDATTMTLMSDDGFEAAYLASSLRGRPAPEPASAPVPEPGAPVAERLRALRGLLDEGLITQDEHDTRRRAIIDGV